VAILLRSSKTTRLIGFARSDRLPAAPACPHAVSAGIQVRVQRLTARVIRMLTCPLASELSSALIDHLACALTTQLNPLVTSPLTPCQSPQVAPAVMPQSAAWVGRRLNSRLINEFSPRLTRQVSRGVTGGVTPPLSCRLPGSTPDIEPSSTSSAVAHILAGTAGTVTSIGTVAGWAELCVDNTRGP
jgi:hypothetical protein